MTAGVPQKSSTPSTPSTLSTPIARQRRLLVAVAAGLIAIVVALGAQVIDLSASRAELQAQLKDDRRVINALTKQLYWAQQQLGQTP